MIIPESLAVPDALIVPGFEARLDQFKQIVIDHIAQSDPVMAAQVSEALENEAELSTKLIEACVVVMQTFVREINEEALQMFAYWAAGNALDAKVSDFGLDRQKIDPGDPDAFPPEPEIYEDDDALRARYFLAPYAFSNAGPSLAYKFHAMTLDERPLITVDSNSENELTLTYKFESGSFAGRVKDADAVRIEQGVVQLTILGHDGDGEPPDSLIAAVEAYFERDDVAVETDTIIVQKAEIVPFEVSATVYVPRGLSVDQVKLSAEEVVATYVGQQHKLGLDVDAGMISYLLYDLGAVRVDMINPVDVLSAQRNQALYCSAVNIDVRGDA